MKLFNLIKTFGRDEDGAAVGPGSLRTYAIPQALPTPAQFENSSASASSR